MLSKEQVIQRLAEHKSELYQRFPLKAIALFGSFASNEQTKQSDIDVLVEFKEPVGFEFIELLEALEKIFNHKIDLVSKAGVKPLFALHRGGRHLCLSGLPNRLLLTC